MGVSAIVIGLVIGLIVLFTVARLLFGSGVAVLLTGLVGFCFGGPPGGGVGIVVGLVLAPITWLLLPPTDE